MSNNQLPPDLPTQKPQPQWNRNDVTPGNYPMPQLPNKKTNSVKIIIIIIACLVGLGCIVSLCNNDKTTKTELRSSDTISTHDKDKKDLKTWEYEEEKDEMTDKITYRAIIRSDNEENFDFPYHGGSYLDVCVRNSPKYGTDVILRITNGQLLSSVFDSNNQVTVKFDEKPAKKYRTAEPADYSSDALFLKNAKDFISNAKTAKKIRIEVPVYNEGNHIFSYELDEPLKWEH